MTLIRTLLVEDYEPSLRAAISMLAKEPGLLVIGEAKDGLDAIQKAEELKPDLILLDIGLPKLNGIEAARRICKLVPESKILFLSQESDVDVVQEALSLGSGYVLKGSAGRELLTAVAAVLQGEQFVSSGLADRDAFSERAEGEAMSEYQGSNQNENDNIVKPSLWQAIPLSVLVTSFILAVAVVVLGVYSYRQATVINRIASQEADLNVSIIELHTQLQEATAKINDAAAAQAAQAAAAANIAQSDARAAAAEADAQATRLRRLQTAVSNQEKKLQATQAQVTKTRSDLEGNLNSTRDELNGSIARTHEELVVLQKRGERNYYEFDIAKSKQFQRTGPLSISVRKTDVKHGYVDLVLLVNDREISKKNVNLYEPVWIYETKDAQPVQVIVNRIDKNLARGYISAQKYSPADLSAIASPAVPPTAAH